MSTVENKTDNKTKNKPKVLLLDNHDSFVYNLVDALSGYDTVVMRNTVTVTEVLAQQPDMIVLSPGPGHPTEAGCMMELIDTFLGKIPLLGICLVSKPCWSTTVGKWRPAVRSTVQPTR